MSDGLPIETGMLSGNQGRLNRRWCTYLARIRFAISNAFYGYIRHQDETARPILGRYMLKDTVVELFGLEFGGPTRETVKVKAFKINEIEAVVQVDQPNKQDACFVWLPYPPEGQEIPEIALEYPGESGRHSGTYASAGLKKGEPALKVVLKSATEADDLVAYIRALSLKLILPPVKATAQSNNQPKSFDGKALVRVDASIMPIPKPPAPRREAIPRAVQREVWQRDTGMCVECGTRQLLCFDHIVPFSLGGSNTVRNLQLLCEPCNLSKGNRI
ncbi:MAG: HNH endonuclease [Pseudomonas sp.]|uniref:HNH endonuclease n=1 Tax=Pseudomonas sp. TaxID=306 RepID=UPI003D6E0A12